MSAIPNRSQRRKQSRPADDTVLRGDQLQVQFAHREDRYAHVISLVRGEELIPLLESLEGSSEQDWPPSPPLQSLHVQPGHEGQLAFLVGMAGPSHWSVAVELVTRGEVEELTFDVACRLNSPGEFLGSSYRIAEDVRVDAESGEIHSRYGTCQLTIPLDGANPTSLFNRDGEIGFGPYEQGHPPPITCRWTYSLRSK